MSSDDGRCHLIVIHRHPSGFSVALRQDEGVILGDVAALGSVEADAVVSLCRMGSIPVAILEPVVD